MANGPAREFGTFPLWDEYKHQMYLLSNLSITVKPVLRGHLETDKTKVLLENGSLMKAERIAVCFMFFLSGRLR